MPYCLICYNKLNYRGIYSFLFKPKICQKCFKQMNRKVKIRNINGFKIYSLYPYQNNIVSLIYQFKGCYDIALAPVFLAYDKIFLKIIYHNYIIVPIPSFAEKDKIRGFNHVEKIFEELNLKTKHLLVKNKDFKQADLSRKEREIAVENIVLTNHESLKGKKILLVDDIITTGNTIKRSIELLKTLKPKKIKIITIAYTSVE